MMTRRLTITSIIPGQALKLRNATSTLKELNLELVSKEDGKVHELVANLTTLPQSTVHGTIRFETDLPREPTVQVPVTISVVNR